MKQGYTAYKSANIDTADQGKLILITYDVAIKHAKLALEIFDDRTQLEQRTKHLFKMQDAITELLSALRLDVGDVAKNLYRLYDYMLRTIIDANIKNNRSKVIEVLGYLESLREAWAEAIIKVKQQSSPQIQLDSVGISG
ncbi:MAG TPA: flagellar export chaperone FliS [Chitinispirillaceae bacterium]|jgi:flagellar protein FliS|nr:flagellar export chaperone FliS [Chitinispirillaceae bacterium]